jgi:hypothetical protein
MERFRSVALALPTNQSQAALATPCQVTSLSIVILGPPDFNWTTSPALNSLTISVPFIPSSVILQRRKGENKWDACDLRNATLNNMMRLGAALSTKGPESVVVSSLTHLTLR